MTEDRSGNHDKSLIRIFLELAGHTLLTTFSFLLIFGAALLLDIFVDWLIDHKIVEYGTGIFWALYIAKYILLLADLIFLVTLVCKLTIRAIKKI